MALSERHRSAIYQGLVPVLGEEEAEALLSQFPARELDEPVTREYVRAEIAEVRLEMAELRTELVDRMNRQTVMLASALAACTALNIAVMGVIVG